jgi:hypothetical protein
LLARDFKYEAISINIDYTIPNSQQKKVAKMPILADETLPNVDKLYPLLQGFIQKQLSTDEMMQELKQQEINISSKTLQKKLETIT